MSTDSKAKLEQKIGEALGLEMAAQKAVQELDSKGLLDEAGMKAKLDKMRKEAKNHQTKLEELVQKLSQSQGLNPENIGHAIATTDARIVDVNSGIEVSPGIKDYAKMKAFVLALHKATVKNNPAYRG